MVVRTLRLPAIENPNELDAAVRFAAQEQIAMPFDQAVVDHRVVGGVGAIEGAAPQIDVIVVAARRDMIAASLRPLKDAGLEPVGVDLSAFGMIRALGDVTARRRRAKANPPSRPSSTATSATSPTSLSPRAAPASSPASPPSASRTSPAGSRPSPA